MVSTPVLATKLFAPARRSQLVARPMLGERLDTTLDAGHRLTLVSAPAGFGKSTLLSDWLTDLNQRQKNTRVGWLSLDDGDNDLTRFMAHLLAALQRAELDVDVAFLDSLSTAPTATALTPLVNDLARAGEQEPGTQWIVVLDDYHAIGASEVHEAVTFLLDHLPDHLHLVMATRSDPPLPLARLRSRGELTELRAAELRFTPPEVGEFLNRVMGLELTAADVDAVQHALAAEDFDRARYLMEEALPEMRRSRQDRLLLTWLRSLPPPVVRRSPVLSLVSAWSQLMSGNLDAVEPRLDDAEAALAAGSHDHDLAATWADTEDLRTAPAMVSIYRASLAQARGDVAGTVGHARHALDLAGPEDRFIRGAGGGYIGLAAWAAGNVDEALATFSDAVRSLHAAGNLVDGLDTTVVLADMWVAAGRPSRARRLYEQALQTSAAGGAPYRATADLHVGLAELDRELDDLPSAEAHLESARVLGERASITENRHRWYVVMAQVRSAGGDYDAATQLLDQAEPLYRPGFYPDVRPIAALKARVQIAAGDLSSAGGWAEDRAITVDDQPDYLREYEHLTLARLLLAQDRADQMRSELVEDPSTGSGRIRDIDGASASSVAALLGLLDRLQAAAVEAGRDGSVLEIRMLQALVHHARGDLAEALAALGGSFAATPEPDSYVRLYLDEGAAMLALLQDATDAYPQARRLLERATTSRGGGRAAAEPGRGIEPTRTGGAAASGQRAHRTRDRPPALRHAEHTAHPYQAHLHQA